MYATALLSIVLLGQPAEPSILGTHELVAGQLGKFTFKQFYIKQVVNDQRMIVQSKYFTIRSRLPPGSQITIPLGMNPSFLYKEVENTGPPVILDKYPTTGHKAGQRIDLADISTMFRVVASVGGVPVIEPAADDAHLYRTWIDRSGKFKVEAKFLAFKRGKVVLQRLDGPEVSVPKTRLSDVDQDYVVQIQRAKLEARQQIDKKKKRRRR